MISEESAVAAIAAMSELISFFPRDENALHYLVVALRKMIATEEQLNWLTETAINSIQKWQGLPQLRGLFCSRFPPADRIYIECDVPGFTIADAERQHFEREAAETDRKIAAWKREQKLLKNQEPLLLDGKIENIAKQKAIPPPGRIPATPIRTPQQRARLEAELLDQLSKTKGHTA